MLQRGKQQAKNRAHGKAEAPLVNDLKDMLGLKGTKVMYPSLQTWEEVGKPSIAAVPPPIDFCGATMTLRNAVLTTLRTRLTQHWPDFCRKDETVWISPMCRTVVVPPLHYAGHWEEDDNFFSLLQEDCNDCFTQCTGDTQL